MTIERICLTRNPDGTCSVEVYDSSGARPRVAADDLLNLREAGLYAASLAAEDEPDTTKETTCRR